MTSSVGYAWSLVGLSAAGTCAGNLLLKQAQAPLAGSSWPAMLGSPWVVGAILCYGVDLVLFAQALRHLPVSAVVPVVSGLRIVATVVLAYALLGEYLTLSKLLATGVITVGVVLMVGA
jgi:undecaprenyl phosphate-alpha-L-ara4N flippase subunit ArnE